ncbi:5'-nucleotidase SurE [Vitis vinifera]|uniref:5'-nucleotidase SurE n=1 Tax=Vitis vinifera TaxID=29760 RepID=A0A438J8W2_VITVI|nr:5'-nucleotidase SurE [Vitis vinifera]
MEPASLISNLQQVLITKREDGNSISSCSSTVDESAVKDCSRAVVLVTNGDGIESPGLTSLVQALLREPRFHVHVCAPQSDKSVSGHSMTVQETLTACSAEIGGATAYEVSGTPADCVSLALSGALFSWSKPVWYELIFILETVSFRGCCWAREALLCGVPALCISMNWKEDVSCDNDFKDAVNVCLPIIHAAIRDIEKGIFPKSCLVNIEIPSSPLKNKGFKVARQSLRRPALIWQAVSATKHPSIGHFMSNQQSLGFKLAQLGRDASAVGAARCLSSDQKNQEIESIGVAGKLSSQKTVKKYFRLKVKLFNVFAELFIQLQFQEMEQGKADEDLDFKAVENGFVAITPHSLSSYSLPGVQTWILNWINFHFPENMLLSS